MSIRYKTIKELRKLLEQKSISTAELQRETIQNIDKIDKSLNAIIENFKFMPDFQNDISSQSCLYGVPFVHKDNILVQGMIASAGSKILYDHISPYTATVIRRVLDVGGYTIGRANCDEFAMGSSGESSYYGPTRNPWDLSCVPGGSSSGSAVAVAAGLVPYSFGSETGGSVRQPSALCGITGLKTSYGLHSRYGLIAYASSLDQIGIFAHTAEDIAIVLSETAGNDYLDHSSITHFQKFNYVKDIAKKVQGVRIGIIENALYADGMSEETKNNLLEAIKVFEKLGCQISYVNLPTMEYCASIYFIISRAEAASNLSRFDGVRYGYRNKKYDDLQEMYQHTRGEGFGYTVKRRIVLGNYVLAAEHADQYYNKAKQIQKVMKAQVLSLFESVDCLFCPVVPEPAFKLGSMSENPLQMDLQDYFTALANLAGLPALALPSGFIKNMPMGFQLIGQYLSELLLLQLGHQYQEATDWHKMYPIDILAKESKSE